MSPNHYYTFCLSDIGLIEIKEATSPDMKKDIQHLRYNGYNNIYSSPSQTWDHFDELDSVLNIIVYNNFGNPTGSVRMLDSRFSEMEIDTFETPYRKLFPTMSNFIEAARLVVKKSELSSRVITQAAIWKYIYSYAKETKIDYILAWSKKGPDQGYKFLKFNLLSNCEFIPFNISIKKHNVFTLQMSCCQKQFEEVDHPLTKFFFHTENNNITATINPIYERLLNLELVANT